MLWALPALIAFIIKVWIFWYYRSKLTSQAIEGKVLLVFLSLLATHNLFEVVGYTVSDVRIRILVMDGWYVFAVLSLTAGAFFTVVISGIRLYRQLMIGFGLAAVLLSITIVFSELVIVSYQEVGAAMTKIPGPYYEAYQVFALGMCVVMLGYLCKGALSKSNVERAKSVTMLAGLLPFILVVLSVLIVQKMGGTLHAGMMVPIAITFFLWVVVHTSTAESIINPLAFLPFFTDSRRRRFAINLLTETDETLPLRRQLQELEDILILKAYRKCNGVQSKAAEELGISPAKMSNRLKAIRKERSRQGIDPLGSLSASRPDS